MSWWAKFPSDRSLVELVRAGVKTGGCVCVSSTETHMASASVHAAPLNVLSSGFKPTLFPGCEITQRQISFHTPRRRQRSTGKIGQFPRGATGPTRRTWRLI